MPAPPSKHIFRAISPEKKKQNSLSLSFAITALITSLLTLHNWDRTQSILWGESLIAVYSRTVGVKINPQRSARQAQLASTLPFLAPPRYTSPGKGTFVTHGVTDVGGRDKHQAMPVCGALSRASSRHKNPFCLN